MPRPKRVEYEQSPYVPPHVQSTESGYVALRVDELSFLVRPSAVEKIREQLKAARRARERTPIR